MAPRRLVPKLRNQKRFEVVLDDNGGAGWLAAGAKPIGPQSKMRWEGRGYIDCSSSIRARPQCKPLSEFSAAAPNLLCTTVPIGN